MAKDGKDGRLMVGGSTASESQGFGDRSLTLEQLRSFVAIVQGGGFQQAGALVSRSQSAVTQSLKRLEECVGCTLLVRRQGHLVGPTPEGRRFLRYAMDVLERVAQAVAVLKQPELKGQVRLGVPDDFMIEHLHAVISSCLVTNPSLRIDVTSAVSSQLQSLFKQQALDIVICKTLEPPSVLPDAYEVLRSEPLHWVADKRLTFDSVFRMPLIVFPVGCTYREAAVAALEQHGKGWYIAYTSASYENVRLAVSAGLGIGILSHSALGAQHVVLDDAHGFPALPMVQLTMAVRPGNALFHQVATCLTQVNL